MRFDSSVWRPVVVTVSVLAICTSARWPVMAEEPASQPASVTPVVGPVTYFIDACSRCHGEIGSPYVGLAAPKRGDALTKVLAEMAEGPAQSPLDEKGLADQKAMHDAFYDRTPYVWIDSSKKDAVTGETLPETTLTLNKGGQTTAVKIEDNRFTLTPSPGATLRAERNGKTTDLRLP